MASYETLVIAVTVAVLLPILIALVVGFVFWYKSKQKRKSRVGSVEAAAIPYPQPQNPISSFQAPPRELAVQPINQYATDRNWRQNVSFGDWPEQLQYATRYRSPYGATDNPTQIILPQITQLATPDQLKPLYVAQPTPKFEFKPITLEDLKIDMPKFDLPRLPKIKMPEFKPIKFEPIKFKPLNIKPFKFEPIKFEPIKFKPLNIPKVTLEDLKIDLPEPVQIDTARFAKFKQDFLDSWNSDMTKTKETFAAVKAYQPGSFILPTPDPIDLTLWKKFENDFQNSWNESWDNTKTGWEKTKTGWDDSTAKTKVWWNDSLAKTKTDWDTNWAKTKETFEALKEYDPKSFLLPEPPKIQPVLSPDILQGPTAPLSPVFNPDAPTPVGYYWVMPSQDGFASQVVYVPGTGAAPPAEDYSPLLALPAPVPRHGTPPPSIYGSPSLNNEPVYATIPASSFQSVNNTDVNGSFTINGQTPPYNYASSSTSNLAADGFTVHYGSNQCAPYLPTPAQQQPAMYQSLPQLQQVEYVIPAEQPQYYTSASQPQPFVNVANF